MRIRGYRMDKIRYADKNDARLLGEIHSASWKVAYKGIVPDEVLSNITVDKRESYFEKALTEGWEEDAIFFKGNQAVGLICIGKCRDSDKTDYYGEIWGIYLLPAYWGQGIGAKLMEWGITELKMRNYKRVTLWVLEDNINARYFYEKKGFKHDGKIKEINIGRNLENFDTN